MAQESVKSGIRVDFDLEMKTSDGITLRADVYRPSEGRWPVLLTRTMYSKATNIGLAVAMHPLRAAKEGFAVVVQDVRGRFASEGDFKPFASESVDGAEAVQWAAAQPWSDGRVAMFGSSYMGATQMQAAAASPPALAALSPIQASSDYWEGRSFRGGAFELGALASVAMWSQGAGTLMRSGLRGEELRKRFAALRRGLSDMTKFLSVTPYEELRKTILIEAAPTVFEWWEHERGDDPYWKEMSLEHRYGNFDVPAFHVTSWYDPFHVGTLRNYEGLRRGAASARARDAQAVLIGPWGHYPPKTNLLGAARVGDLDLGLDAVLDIEALQLAWFQKWMHNDQAAWKWKQRVRLFVMGKNIWRDEEDWPLARARETPYFLQGGRGVGPANSAKAEIDRFRFDPSDPVPTHGGAHLLLESVFPQGPLDQREIEARPDVVVYDSPVLERELEVTGWVKAKLFVRSSAPSTDFTVKLVDRHPDGRSFNVCDGIRRVTFPKGGNGSGWFEVLVELGATSMVFLPGHRLSVQISSSNFPRFDLNPNTGELPRTAKERVPAAQEISVGGDFPSHLILPIVENAKG